MSVATSDELQAYHRPTLHRSRSAILAVTVAAVIVVVGIPMLTSIRIGAWSYAKLFLGYPGETSAMIATGMQTLADAASWVTIGALVVLMFLHGKPGRDRMIVDDEPEWRIARAGALTWAVLALLMAGVEAADSSGAPLSQIFLPGGLAYLFQISYQPTAWAIVCVLMFIATVAIQFAQRWNGLILPLVLCTISLLAPVVVGQVLVGPNHDFGSDAATIQTPAAAVACGTAIVLAIRVARGRLLRPVTLRRAWLLGAACWALIVACELVLIPYKLTGPATGNPTWVLVLVRLTGEALFGVVLLSTWLRRRRITDRTVCAALSVAVVAAAVYGGVTVAMTRVPPPDYFVKTSIEQLFFGYDLPDAPTLLNLALQWRPNILFLTIAAAAVTVYVAAVVRLRRRGDTWPAGRTAAWIIGWIVVVIATSSGLGKYAGASFAVHMAAHMTLNMLAPVFLVLGGVVTLLLRATRPARRGEAGGPHEWLNEVLHWNGMRIVYHPLRVFVMYVATYYVLYFTPLFGTFIRYHWAHRLMDIEFLVIGYLFFALIIGVDRPPRPLPPIGKLGFTLAAMPFHAFFGVILMTAAVPVAANFYRTVDASWMGDLKATQYVGGGIAWAAGEIPLLIVVVALGIQWARQDQREARRKDRHLDLGLDDEFEVYNRMLQRLEERSVPTEHTPVPADRRDPA